MALDTSEVGVSNATGAVETQEVAPPTEEPTTPDTATEIPTDGEPESVSPTPGDELAEDDGEDEGTETGEQTEEQKKLSRRERQRLREQERIDKAVEERLAARESERAAKVSAEQAEAKAKADAEAWRQRFGEYVGTPEARASLSKEIDDLISTTISVDPEVADNDELLRLTTAQKALAEKRAALARLDENARVYRELDDFQFENTRADFASRADRIPEAHRSAYLSVRTVDEALTRLEAGVRADEQAKAKAASDKLEAEWRGRYEKEVAAHAMTRTGAPGAGPAPNGVNGSGGSTGALTAERYASMSFEDRQKLRSTPEGRAQIDQMSRRPGFGQQSA